MLTSETIKQGMMAAMTRDDLMRQNTEMSKALDRRAQNEVRLAHVLFALAAADFIIEDLPLTVESDGKVAFVRECGVWRLLGTIDTDKALLANPRIDDSPASTAYRVGHMLGIPYSRGGYDWLEKKMAEPWHMDVDKAHVAWMFKQVLNGLPPHVQSMVLASPTQALRAVGAAVDVDNTHALVQAALDAGVESAAPILGTGNLPILMLHQDKMAHEALRILAENGHSLEACKSSGTTVFLLASAKLDEELLEGIIALSANVHAVNVKGQGAIHMAIEMAEHDDMARLYGVIRTLVDAGVDPDIADLDGNTPAAMMEELLTYNDVSRNVRTVMMRAIQPDYLPQPRTEMNL